MDTARFSPASQMLSGSEPRDAEDHLEFLEDPLEVATDSLELGDDSGSWAIPLVRVRHRPETPGELDADWFARRLPTIEPGAGDRELDPSSVRIVSRSRLRWARLLFALLFLGVLMLLLLEADALFDLRAQLHRFLESR